MGGYGSGKWHRWNTKGTTYGSQPLDVRDLHRKGLLQPGSVFSSRWWRVSFEERASSISGVARDGYVSLFYRSRSGAGDWEEVEETVRLDWTPCHYGGRRPWWLCPRCGRRVAILYGAGRLFLCRHCYRLAYPSQNQGPVDRARERAQAIRRRLGGTGSLLEAFPTKPNGMRWQTYFRLWRFGQVADMAWLQALDADFKRMDARLKRTIRGLGRD